MPNNAKAPLLPVTKGPVDVMGAKPPLPPSSRPVRRPKRPVVSDWPSMYVIFLVVLLTEAAGGLIMPSLWPHLQAVGGTREDLGLVVASFSVGTMLATIPLGYLSDRMSTRTILVSAAALQVVGNGLYTLAPATTAIAATRILVGFGSATMSVCRAHVTRSTPKEQRTFIFACLSALQFIGLAILPIFGGIFGLLPHESIFKGILNFNAATYPALALVIANLAAGIVIFLVYNDPVEQKRPNTGLDPSARTMYGSLRTSPSLTLRPDEADPNWVALRTCLLFNVFYKGLISALEIVTPTALMVTFGLSVSQTSFYMGAICLPGLLSYVALGPLARRCSDGSIIMASLVVAVGALTLLMQPVFEIPFWLYLFALSAIWSVTYPLGQTASLSLFSKVLAGLPAGGFLGVFTAAGSVSRIALAIAAADAWQNFGLHAVFGLLAFLTLVITFSALAVYRSLDNSFSA